MRAPDSEALHAQPKRSDIKAPKQLLFITRCRLRFHVEKRPESFRHLRQHLGLHLSRDLIADRHPDFAHRLGARSLHDLFGDDGEVFRTDFNGDFQRIDPYPSRRGCGRITSESIAHLKRSICEVSQIPMSPMR
jgi:hypothetical protein